MYGIHTTRGLIGYPKGAVVVFNQKIREAEPGTKGKLTGIVKAGLLVEVGSVRID